MGDTTAVLLRKINSAGDLQSVVRTMKALAASNIGQYASSVGALADYYRAIELGLGACIRDREPSTAPLEPPSRTNATSLGAIVFGSDQGLVGQFNEVVVNYAISSLAAKPGKPRVWAVGERVSARLADAGLPPEGSFEVPDSIKSITMLVGQIQVEIEAQRSKGEFAGVYVYHNCPKAGALYEPASQRLLPLDREWRLGLANLPWPPGCLPEVIGGDPATLLALIREYLFISLFRSCAESLASENASRLAAMERAEKNILDLLEDLRGSFHRLRQSRIDEELFDVISGFTALA